MSKIKKRLITIGILVAIISIGAVTLYINMEKTTSTYKDFDFGSIDLSMLADGTYIGSEDGGIVKASVEVTVKDHVIKQVSILSHDCGLGKPAEVIVEEIVKNNSLQVDTVSGATYSSDVIRMATYNALSK